MSTGTGNAPNSPYQRVRNGSSYDMRDLSGAPSIGRPPTVTAPGSPSWRPTRDFTVNSTTPTSVNRGLPSSPQDFETAVLHILKKLEYEMWQNESAKLKDDLTTRDRAVGVVNSMTVVVRMYSKLYSTRDLSSFSRAHSSQVCRHR
ncbi:hypothetical protein PLICRDRAFT_266613 [Plicaturopsis crispa FD-325 SS-3]|nr:hypothetical protein PLICRDRAFT_266613 [Plicaturopsis crispa FD-325 SS-3]